MNIQQDIDRKEAQIKNLENGRHPAIAREWAQSLREQDTCLKKMKDRVIGTRFKKPYRVAMEW